MLSLPTDTGDRNKTTALKRIGIKGIRSLCLIMHPSVTSTGITMQYIKGVKNKLIGDIFPSENQVSAITSAKCCI